MFCKTCGAEIPDDAQRCSQCGANPHAEPADTGYRKVHVPYQEKYKSRLVAGLLQILLGFIGLGGIGRLYLGYTTLGILQLVIPYATCGAGILWSVIDGIMILTGSVHTDAFGNPLN